MFGWFGKPSAIEKVTITRSDLGATTTADRVVDLYKDDIRGKIILITGVSPGGLGAECAMALVAASPKLIILAGRSAAKVAETATVITEKFPDAKTRNLILDIASVKASEKAAKEVIAWDDVPHVDVLINNAGVINTNLGRQVSVKDMIVRIFYYLRNGGPSFKTLQAGTATHIMAAFDPKLKEYIGEYISDCVPTPPTEAWGGDKDGAEKLWKLTEKLLRKSYDI